MGERVEYVWRDNEGERYDGYPCASLDEAKVRQRDYDERFHPWAPFTIVKRTIIEEDLPND